MSTRLSSRESCTGTTQSRWTLRHSAGSVIMRTTRHRCLNKLQISRLLPGPVIRTFSIAVSHEQGQAASSTNNNNSTYQAVNIAVKGVATIRTSCVTSTPHPEPQKMKMGNEGAPTTPDVQDYYQPTGPTRIAGSLQL